MPRFIHRLYAWFSGYFWLPCERCGRMFGGHEIGSDVVPVLTPDRGVIHKVTCRFCAGGSR